MPPDFLLPESIARADGTGPEIDLGSKRGALLVLTLGITRIIEQESLDVSIWGSADGTDWGAKALITFPQKFYCGTYQLILDLTEHPEIKHLRAKWQVGRWGKGDPRPLFTVYLFIQAMERELALHA